MRWSILAVGFFMATGGCFGVSEAPSNEPSDPAETSSRHPAVSTANDAEETAVGNHTDCDVGIGYYQRLHEPTMPSEGSREWPVPDGLVSLRLFTDVDDRWETELSLQVLDADGHILWAATYPEDPSFLEGWAPQDMPAGPLVLNWNASGYMQWGVTVFTGSCEDSNPELTKRFEGRFGHPDLYCDEPPFVENVLSWAGPDQAGGVASGAEAFTIGPNALMGVVYLDVRSHVGTWHIQVVDPSGQFRHNHSGVAAKIHFVTVTAQIPGGNIPGAMLLSRPEPGEYTLDWDFAGAVENVDAKVLAVRC